MHIHIPLQYSFTHT